MAIKIGQKEITTISLTTEDLNALDLMSLRHQIKRSPMVSRLIALHANIDENIGIIAEQLIADFSNSNADYEDFIASAKIWLEQKNICAYHIERIVDEVKSNYEKE